MLFPSMPQDKGTPGLPSGLGSHVKLLSAICQGSLSYAVSRASYMHSCPNA
jgi:hypothetical protein